MLVVGVKPGSGVRIGDMCVIMEGEHPDRRLTITGQMPQQISITLGKTTTRLLLGDTNVVLWKTQGNSIKMGVSSDRRLPVSRVRRDLSGEIVVERSVVCSAHPQA